MAGRPTLISNPDIYDMRQIWDSACRIFFSVWNTHNTYIIQYYSYSQLLLPSTVSKEYQGPSLPSETPPRTHMGRRPYIYGVTLPIKISF